MESIFKTPLEQFREKFTLSINDKNFLISHELKLKKKEIKDIINIKKERIEEEEYDIIYMSIFLF